MTDTATEMVATTVIYQKHRYACRFRIRAERLNREGTALRQPEPVEATVSRWLRRCAAGEAIVMGRPRLEIREHFLSDRHALAAIAPAFRDVAPEDRNILATVVDRVDSSSVQIPRHIPVPIKAWRA